jgi:hypothetical protein
LSTEKSSDALISEECDRLKAMLLEKNRAYGDSALAPLRIFSRADAAEQIRVRVARQRREVAA